jgi:hypothetical protein
MASSAARCTYTPKAGSHFYEGKNAAKGSIFFNKINFSSQKQDCPLETFPKINTMYDKNG